MEAAAVEMTTKSDSSLSDMQNAFTVFRTECPLVVTALMRQSEERSQLCELFDVSSPCATTTACTAASAGAVAICNLQTPAARNTVPPP